MASVNPNAGSVFGPHSAQRMRTSLPMPRRQYAQTLPTGVHLRLAFLFFIARRDDVRALRRGRRATRGGRGPRPDLCHVPDAPYSHGRGAASRQRVVRKIMRFVGVRLGLVISCHYSVLNNTIISHSEQHRAKRPFSLRGELHHHNLFPSLVCTSAFKSNMRADDVFDTILHRCGT